MNFNRHLIVLVFLIALGISSCKKSEKEIESEWLKGAVEQAWVDSDYQWIVVLPGLGCHGCIQEAEVFMRDNIENKQVLFVLTKISSLKILQHKTGIDIATHSNILVDREDIFFVPTKNSIYPCIISLGNGYVKNHESQSPHNGQAFRKLETLIAVDQ